MILDEKGRGISFHADHDAKQVISLLADGILKFPGIGLAMLDGLASALRTNPLVFDEFKSIAKGSTQDIAKSLKIEVPEEGNFILAINLPDELSPEHAAELSKMLQSATQIFFDSKHMELKMTTRTFTSFR